MYIVYILNPLVIDIKNIFNTIISVVYPTTLGIEKISVEIASRQTSQWITAEENMIKNYFTANNFHKIFFLVHTNSFKFIIR